VRITTQVASAILGTGLSSLLAGAALAEAEDCTWLPDLRCERSGGRWEGFEKPIVGFAQFEDPFITTGLYPYFVWHEYPSSSVMGGGELFAVAVQARLAITDKLAFIATKDGYVWNRPELELNDVAPGAGRSHVLPDTQGYLNIAAGLKYALIEDRENHFILSPAVRIELATGSSDTFQGYGNGLWIPSVSAAWSPLEDVHLMGGIGGEIPFSSGKLSSSIFYHLYGDYKVNDRFQPFAQLSGIHWVESGRGELPVRTRLSPPLRDLTLTQAQDATRSGRDDGTAEFNLGSKGVDNNDLITFAVGSHFPITKHVTFSVAYERPVTTRKGIFKQRITTGMRFEF
jgi:hypothetical protein